jgi:hypothetical protein
MLTDKAFELTTFTIKEVLAVSSDDFIDQYNYWLFSFME